MGVVVGRSTRLAHSIQPRCLRHGHLPPRCLRHGHLAPRCLRHGRRRLSTDAVPRPPAPSLAVVGAEPSLRFPVNNIYCVGRNYSEHAREMRALGDTSGDEREPPFFFLKPGDALVSHASGEALSGALAMPYPPLTEALHYEAELVVCLAEGGQSIPVEQAMSKVYGYAVGLDMTRRDLQDGAKKAGRPWDAAKAFAHSAPCTAVVPAAAAAAAAGEGAASGAIEGRIWLKVDGEMRQVSDINCLTWGVAETIAALSSSFTLQAGDIIMTGTPAGVGAVVPGQQITAGVDSLGLGSVQLTVDIVES